MTQQNSTPKLHPLFEGREYEAQKVEWMTVLYPRVNSKEYHAFRKAHETLTHHDHTAISTAAAFTGKDISRDAIINHLRKNYIEKQWKDGDIEVQVAQFLGQLTLKGWNALINHITKIHEGRK